MKSFDRFDVGGINSSATPIGRIVKPWNMMPLVHRSIAAYFPDAMADKDT